MPIIGIAGKKQVGKDLTANIIQYLCAKDKCPLTLAHVIYEVGKDWPSDYEVVKFADKLKDIVCLLIGCTREQLEDETFKNTPLGKEWETPLFTNHIYTEWTPRLLMQYLGTEVFRNNVCENTWVNSTMVNYTPHSNWIISDVRFPDEVTAIQDKGGIVIRINRDSVLSTDQHESEIALDDYDNFDYVIENNKTIDILIRKIRELLILEGIIQ